MKRMMTGLVSASALSLLLAGPVMAAGTQSSQGMEQPGAGQQGMAPPGMGQQAQAPNPQQDYLANNLIGEDVQNSKGDSLGKISNLIITPDGKVSNVVVESGGIAGVGADKYVVPFNRVQLSKQQNVAILDVQQGQLSSEFSAFEEDQYQAQKKQQQPQQQNQQQQEPTQ